MTLLRQLLGAIFARRLPATACVYRHVVTSTRPFGRDAFSITVDEFWRESRGFVVVRKWKETKEWCGSPSTGWLRTDVTGPTVLAARWQKECFDAAFALAWPKGYAMTAFHHTHLGIKTTRSLNYTTMSSYNASRRASPNRDKINHSSYGKTAPVGVSTPLVATFIPMRQERRDGPAEEVFQGGVGLRRVTNELCVHDGVVCLTNDGLTNIEAALRREGGPPDRIKEYYACYCGVREQLSRLSSEFQEPQ